MKPQICDPKQCSIFLADGMSPRQEQAFVAHLDCCETCRNLLQQQAAVDDRWAEARAMLSGSTVQDVDATSVPQAGAIPVLARQVLGSLGPTDEPNSLGRLDHYEVRGVVGVGAMGVVLKADDPQLDRVVAIKVMSPALADCGTARQRFAREAKAGAAVLHPNVISIHSVSTASALPYLAMPYISGMSLQQRLDKDGPLSLQEILRVGSQVAAGLAAAHHRGLIHRDIKPANIMLDAGVETAVITDFGLARTIDDATMTRSGAITGTPGFMSPEQARGDVIGFKSDVFSLGSVLYTICTGHAPFRAETSFGVLRRITDEEPRPIREFNPEIPRWMCSLIALLHSKNPETRPDSVETQRLLETCLAHTHQPDVIALPARLQESTRQQPRYFLRPPVVFGAILMLAIITLLAASAFTSSGPDGLSDEQTGPMPTKLSPSAKLKTQLQVYRTVPLKFPNPKASGLLDIDLQRGFIEVVGSEESDAVLEILIRQPPADAGSVLKSRFAPQYDVRTTPVENKIKFDVSSQDYVLNVRVRVPKRTNLNLDTYRDGYIAVRDISGNVRTRSQHCDIALSNISGSGSGYSYNGNLTASFRSVASDASLSFETYNGNIDLTLPPKLSATFAVSAGVGNYKTNLDLVPTDSPTKTDFVKLQEKFGSRKFDFATINGGGVPIRLECKKGNIVVRTRQ